VYIVLNLENREATMNAETAREALEREMKEWEAKQNLPKGEKALTNSKEAADALKMAIAKEFWARGKKYC
jgi:hypothetical protein